MVGRRLVGERGRAMIPVLPPLHRPVRTIRLLRLPPGWPVIALLAGFPIWWALGFAVLVYPLLALPMVVHLWRRRPVKLPPGFGIWVLFLVWQILGIAALGLNPPGTVAEGASGRLIAYSTRLGIYLAVTVMLLFIGNLTEAELPRRLLIVLLSWMFVFTVAGGILGVLAPTFNFTSPLELVLPSGIRSHQYVQNLVHPASSQVQAVLGYAAPRPKAPFEYTNAWGNNFSIFAIWVVVLAAMGGLARRPAIRWVLLVGAFAVGAVPAIFSLNRGMWIGVAFAAVYVAIRLALRRHYAPLASLVVAASVLAMVVALTPLHQIITGRIQNPHSNQIRESNTQETITLVNRSPVIGYGSTRIKQGSADSIAVGRSPRCPKCGNLNIGSNGQLWLVLMASGYVGTALYLGFFLFLIWRYRRDASPIGLAGSIVLCLTLLYSSVYDAFSSPLAFYFLSLALLWRNELDSRSATAVASRVPIIARIGRSTA
jgi:hypothetical protein